MDMTANDFITQRKTIDQSNSASYDLKFIMRSVSQKNLDSFKRYNIAKLKNMLAQKELSFQEVVLILMYKLSKYLGLTAYKLANKRGVTSQPLCPDALNIFQNDKNMRLEAADQLFKSYVSICSMLKSTKKIKVTVSNNNNDENYLAGGLAQPAEQEYELNLHSSFLQYKMWLSKAKLASEKFIKSEKIKRNTWFKLTCKMNKLNVNDERVMRIYNEAIKNDSATRASKFLGKAVERLSDAINDRDNEYKYAFYTLKLFDINKKTRGIPTDVGLNDEIMSGFTLPIDIRNILADNSIDKNFYLSEDTRKALDQTFKGLADINRSGKPIEPVRDVVADGAGEEMNTTRVRSSSVDSKKDEKSSTRKRSSSFGRNLFTRPKSSVIPSSGEAEKPSDASTEEDSRSIEKLKKAKVVYQYTGDVLGKLYNKKKDLLNEDVQQEIKSIIEGKRSNTNKIMSLLQKEKSFNFVNDRDKSYKIKFPHEYENFKQELSITKERADELKNEISTVGKTKRDEWLKGQCDLYHLDVTDKSVDKSVTDIYEEAIADDPTITTSKRLKGVIEGLKAAIEDKYDEYKHAFYTLKLFSGDTIKQVDIPIGCGLGSGITSAFFMVPEFNAISGEGTLDREFYLNKKTRDTIDKKLKKLAHIDFDIPQGSAGGMTWDDDDDIDFDIPQGSAGGMTLDDDDDDAEQAIPKPPSELPKWVIEKMKNESPVSSKADSGGERSSEYKKKSVKDIVKELEGKMPSDTTKNR